MKLTKSFAIFWHSFLIAGFFFCCVPSLQAQAYPSKTITLVSPFPAGGGGDALIRPLAKRMAEILGQPVVVDNKPGAGQTIGSAFVAKANPDGYTLLAHFLPTHVNVAAVYPIA